MFLSSRIIKSSLIIHSSPNRYLRLLHRGRPQGQEVKNLAIDRTVQSRLSSESSSAQQRAYEHYRRSSSSSFKSKNHERNVRIASYATAVVVGALGATYASVPLYKAFCQATGFGGTTQRVSLTDWADAQDRRQGDKSDNIGDGSDNNSPRTSKISQNLWDKLTDMSNIPTDLLPKRGSPAHGSGGWLGDRGKRAKTWTDEEAAERLASLRPVKNGRLITVRFDSTVGDVMPWTFVPSQLDVKIVPGETALSFFTVTNHSDKSITGVATYNVHPPKAGLYFNKIQCFCFEEQRLLPGETVDMPVFFFVDPDYADDPQLARVNNITLSYTFFQTDEDDLEDDEDDEDDEDEEAA